MVDAFDVMFVPEREREQSPDLARVVGTAVDVVVAAIVGSAVIFALGHVLAHPPGFLLAVLAAGLLLAGWRWACRDLVGPVIGHTLADLAL